MKAIGDEVIQNILFLYWDPGKARKRKYSEYFDFMQSNQYEEMNLTATGEQQIGIAKPEIERCGTHMLRPSSSSGLSMADDDDEPIRIH